MELTFSNEFDYIPYFNKNRETDNPIKITCRYMTTPERVKYIDVELLAKGTEVQTKTVFKNEGIIKVSILKIENLKVNGMDIKTAKDLLMIEGLSQLSDEIASAIATNNLMPDLKN